MAFIIESEGITGGRIADKYGKRSDAVINGVPQTSFPLKWHGHPEETQSFAIVFIDNDNYEDEGVAWLHWCAANIPAQITELAENCSIDIKKVDDRIIQGMNSWMNILPRENPECSRFSGPAPESRPHEYEIRIYALSSFLDLKDKYYYNRFLKQIEGKVLAEAVITGVYDA